MVAFVSNKREVIFKAVEDMYTQVATSPLTNYHFPVGRDACRVVGYPDDMLEPLPPGVMESFAGVGNPFAADVIRPGDTVLDLGSGSGTDAFIANRLVGEQGRVYALDMTAAMRTKLQKNAAQAGIKNIEVIGSNAEAIPLPDASVDVVTSNGVLNLVPDKPRAIAEIHRVLKPGGRLQLSDIALARSASAKAKRDPKLWAECVVGAVEQEKYVELFRAAGLRNVELVGSLDYFAASSSEDTRMIAGYLGAHSVTLRARKPQPWEQASVGADTSAFARLVRSAAQQIGGITAAALAGAACLGVSALVSAATAIGATALTDHATLYPIFVGFVVFSLWQLYRSTRERRHIAPFLLGLAGGLTAAVFLWLMVTGTVPLPAWALYSAIGVLVAGSLWEIAARYYEECIVMVRREMARPTAAPPGRRIASGAALSVAAAAAFYGLYKSVEVTVPKAAAADIACYGINACKGQAQCASALNNCRGQNTCKGKGYLFVPSSECADRGGVPFKGSPADPASRA